MQKSVISKFTIPGFHQWSEAPDKYKYLRNRHRHVFYFEVEVKVKNDNREIEFIDLGEQIRKAIFWKYREQDIGYNKIDFGNRSCEQICENVYDIMHRNDSLFRPASNLIRISVLEDNENGATAYF